MKSAFINGAKALTSAKGGKYLTIPFRFATPGALGESSVFSGVLPKEVYEVVKSKSGMTSALGGKIESGSKLKVFEIPEKYRTPLIRPKIETTSKIFEEYKHKTSIFAGMQKETKFYEKATQGQYVTFRRVSSINSDAKSWIHRGIVARRFAEEALSTMNIAEEVKIASDNYLNKLGI